MSSPQCANCDVSLSSLVAYECSECPVDMSPSCESCAQALHRPKRSRRHRLRVRLPQGREAATRAAMAAAVGAGGSGDDDEAEVALSGRGFCDECMAAAGGSVGVGAVRLAVLQCEQCASGVCMRCDGLVHRSLDRDAHTRQYFDEDDDDHSGSGSSVAAAQRSLFTLAGQRDLSLLHRDSLPSYAGRIWPGSMMLARYCEQMEREEPGVWKDKRILELGCGCASIPSVACWLMGAASLVCTDMNEDGLEILKENIISVRQQVEQRRGAQAGDSEAAEAAASSASASSAAAAASSSVVPPASACSGTMSTRQLSFGEDAPDLGPFDFILGSYILYDPDSFVALAATLGQLTGADTTVLLTSHEPTRERALLDALAAQNLHARRVLFSLQSAQLSDDTLMDVAKSDLGTGLRSTSILVIRRKEKETG